MQKVFEIRFYDTPTGSPNYQPVGGRLDRIIGEEDDTVHLSPIIESSKLEHGVCEIVFKTCFRS